jgi:hypothetical protein
MKSYLSLLTMSFVSILGAAMFSSCNKNGYMYASNYINEFYNLEFQMDSANNPMTNVILSPFADTIYTRHNLIAYNEFEIQELNLTNLYISAFSQNNNITQLHLDSVRVYYGANNDISNATLIASAAIPEMNTSSLFLKDHLTKIDFRDDFKNNPSHYFFTVMTPRDGAPISQNYGLNLHFKYKVKAKK